MFLHFQVWSFAACFVLLVTGLGFRFHVFSSYDSPLWVLHFGGWSFVWNFFLPPLVPFPGVFIIYLFTESTDYLNICSKSINEFRNGNLVAWEKPELLLFWINVLKPMVCGRTRYSCLGPQALDGANSSLHFSLRYSLRLPGTMSQGDTTVH
jgi:hypothetical protein